MEELIQAKGNSYYLPGITKIGVVKTAEDKVVLIDSGLDDDDGARALRAITAMRTCRRRQAARSTYRIWSVTL